MTKSRQKLTETLHAVPEAVHSDDTVRAPSLRDLPDAFAAADEATTALAQLCQALERCQDIDPQKRAVLAPVSLATGEYRDRLFSLLRRMDNEGFFENGASHDKH